MLSNTWSTKQDDRELRNNFLRDYSRILLSLSRIPIPRIGSFIVDGEGFLTLRNRPLSMELQQLENENIPTYLPRDSTYSSVESYVVDILGIHDSRLRHQPNAINNVQDCVYQMSALAAMRAISPMFLHKSMSRGPFVFTLTDLHQSNIFVDDEWHITCLVDLEWACSRPIQMVELPYWLTNKGIDEIDIEEFDAIQMEMISIMRTEESSDNVFSKGSGKYPLLLSEVMEQAWTTGTYWYFLALSTPTGLFRLFYERIQPLLSKHRSDEVGEVLPFYWERDVGKFVVAKLADKTNYDTELHKAFATTFDSAPC
jgi:hypothetical protein